MIQTFTLFVQPVSPVNLSRNQLSEVWRKFETSGMGLVTEKNPVFEIFYKKHRIDKTVGSRAECVAYRLASFLGLQRTITNVTN